MTNNKAWYQQEPHELLARPKTLNDFHVPDYVQPGQTQVQFVQELTLFLNKLNQGIKEAAASTHIDDQQKAGAYKNIGYQAKLAIQEYTNEHPEFASILERLPFPQLDKATDQWLANVSRRAARAAGQSSFVKQ